VKSFVESEVCLASETDHRYVSDTLLLFSVAATLLAEASKNASGSYPYNTFVIPFSVEGGLVDIVSLRGLFCKVKQGDKGGKNAFSFATSTLCASALLLHQLHSSETGEFEFLGLICENTTEEKSPFSLLKRMVRVTSCETQELWRKAPSVQSETTIFYADMLSSCDLQVMVWHLTPL
jgi:hypothetical protein